MPGHSPTKHWSSSDHSMTFTYRALSFTTETPKTMPDDSMISSTYPVDKSARSRPRKDFVGCSVSTDPGTLSDSVHTEHPTNGCGASESYTVAIHHSMSPRKIQVGSGAGLPTVIAARSGRIGSIRRGVGLLGVLLSELLHAADALADLPWHIGHAEPGHPADEEAVTTPPDAAVHNRVEPDGQE